MKKSELEKRLLKLIIKYGIFNERPFIKKEYRNEFIKDLLKLYENIC